MWQLVQYNSLKASILADDGLNWQVAGFEPRDWADIIASRPQFRGGFLVHRRMVQMFDWLPHDNIRWFAWMILSRFVGVAKLRIRRKQALDLARAREAVKLGCWLSALPVDVLSNVFDYLQ
jgi:hypothetical protein